VLPKPRPGVWGNAARPGEIVEILVDGTRIFNFGGALVPWIGGGKDEEMRRALGYVDDDGKIF
jgi:hypothetical protein